MIARLQCIISIRNSASAASASSVESATCALAACYRVYNSHCHLVTVDFFLLSALAHDQFSDGLYIKIVI
jgi:hypothetical protein